MEKRTIFTILISIGVIMMLLGGYSLISGTPLLSTFGSSTLSISKVDLKSSFSPLSGGAWMITLRAGGLGQSYYGSFDADEIEDDDKTATNDFTIDVEYEDQVCNYDISAGGSKTPIYDDLKMVTWYCVRMPSYETAKEKFGSGTVLYQGKDPISSGKKMCWAVGSPTQSQVGNFESPDVESEYTITIEVDGDEVSKTINSLSDSSAGMIGDYAYAAWNGNLVSGKSCPDKDPYLPVYTSGKWRIGDEESYDEYKSWLSNLATSNRDEREIAIRNSRTYATRAKSGGSFGSFNSQTSLSSASVDVVLQDAVQFPLTTIYIKADKLGIYTPSSSVKLYDPNSECFTTGEQGSIEVGIENTGDERWSGRIYAECDGAFSASRAIDISLGVGRKTTRYIPITASASSHDSSHCIIYAEGVGSSDEVRVDVCVDPQITCSALEKFCSTDGDKAAIKKCSSDGATSSVVKTCNAGEFCEDLECVSGNDDDEDSWFQNIKDWVGKLFSGFFDFFTTLKLAIVAIFSIVSIFVSSDLLNEIKSLREIPIAKWLVAIIIGIGLAFVLYSFIGSLWFLIALLGGTAYLLYGKPIVRALGITGR